MSSRELRKEGDLGALFSKKKQKGPSFTPRGPALIFSTSPDQTIFSFHREDITLMYCNIHVKGILFGYYRKRGLKQDLLFCLNIGLKGC